MLIALNLAPGGHSTTRISYLRCMDCGRKSMSRLQRELGILTCLLCKNHSPLRWEGFFKDQFWGRHRIPSSVCQHLTLYDLDLS